jgi:hypothetical protein
MPFAPWVALATALAAGSPDPAVPRQPDPGWSFRSSEITAALGAPGLRVLIAESTPADPRSAEAVAAFARAVRAAGDTPVLLGGAEVRALTEGEVEIVGLCTLRQAQVFAIVQLLTPAPVVRLYDRSGRERGEVAALLPQAPALERQPPPPAWTPPPPPPFLSYRGDGAVDVVSGRYLPPPEFYAVVGRPDLVASYRARTIARPLLKGLGGSTIGVAAVWALADLVVKSFIAGLTLPICVLSAPGEPSPDYHSDDACKAPSLSPDPYYLGAVGIGLLVGGHVLSPLPIGGAEADELARQYNERTRGLGARAFVAPGGGGLSVSGRF